MILDPYNQTDHPECKSRPESGLSAITELDPGYITGMYVCMYNVLLCLILILFGGVKTYLLVRGVQVLCLQCGKSGLNGVLSLVLRLMQSLLFHMIGDCHLQCLRSETFTFTSSSLYIYLYFLILLLSLSGPTR